MPHDVPSKKPIIVDTVYPMCESCGVRSPHVKDRKVGLFIVWRRRLCGGCWWQA
jgi:hypothetical protein